MQEGIVWIAEKITHPLNTTAACAGVATTAGWWLYGKLITDPLRLFYFTGLWWHNAPRQEICFRLTNIEAKWWLTNPDRMSECMALTEREFESWDATVMTVLYFTVLTFGVLQCLCQCCVVKPIIRALHQENNVRR